MIPKEFIIKDYPLLKTTDTCGYALKLSKFSELSVLPVVEDGQFIGVWKRPDKCEDPEDKLKELVSKSIPVLAITDLREILQVSITEGNGFVAVVDSSNRYLGVITNECLLEELGRYLQVDRDGSFIVLQIKQTDVIPSRIAKLVEDYNMHLYQMIITPPNTSGNVLIYLSVDALDATPLVRSFERFDMSVVSHFTHSGEFEELHRERIEELVHLLEL